MRAIPQPMADIIASGDFTGPNKAVGRVVIYDDPFLGIYSVPNWKVDRDGKKKVQQTFTSLNFRQAQVHGKELPNVKSINWNRSVDGGIGSATIELWNTKPLPPGTTPTVGDPFDLLGYYTYNRGRTSYSQTNWGHEENEWRDVLVPDSMLMTYQGYGTPDYDVVPELDSCVLRTGVWLIDDVTYTADGLITLECRDAARLLADQISFPPVVPLPLYPQSWEAYKDVQLPDKEEDVATGWYRPKYDTNSNAPYVGVNGTMYGHHGVDAFDGSESTYWLSVGNQRPNQGYSFEHIQGKLTNATISAAKCKVWGGPYKVYFSVFADGAWQGNKVVPYDPNNPASAPNGSDIPYIASGRVGKDGWVTFSFKGIDKVTAVRFTFGDLYNSGIGTYKYRAGVRDFQVTGTKPTMVDGGIEKRGNYGDYSHIVKMLLAWGGFYWPQDGKEYLTNTNTVTRHFAADDAFLQKGRIWGDIELAGTAGITPLGVEVFDKKPLLDCLTYIKDILGFIFFVDEQGAAQWRSPNVFKLGNWLSNADGLNLTRSLLYITVDDANAILGLRSKLSSRNIRDSIFVANVNGKTGAVAHSRVPQSAGFRRVGGWTDQNFSTTAECQVMADMITIRQLFTYRTNSVRIPANPSIQIDDQVQLVERTTGEQYRHYVSGISSQWDAETGQWMYDLTTSWLGEDPSGEWAFQTTGLADETIAYLTALGQVGG